jgi:hypothetical protein
MGHHFDSPESRADSRINITDNYLFAADDPGKVVAVMCVSPLAGLPSPYHHELQSETLRPGCAYDLRFDTDGDVRADVVFRFVFTGDTNPQPWSLRYLVGAEATDPQAQGRELGSGLSGETTTITDVGRVWVGVAGDPFWLDAVAAKMFLDGVLGGGPWQPDSFSNGQLTTGATNVIAIVAELPIVLIGTGRWGFFTTVSADDHGRWTQVNRCGRPNFAATFVDDPQLSLLYNSTNPDTDLAQFGSVVADVVTRLTRNAGTASDPAQYGKLAARALLPDVIPFDPQLPVSYGFGGINGRGLRDDFGAVVYTTVYNFPMRTAIPPLNDIRAEWPYVPPARPLPTGGASVPSRNQ